MLSPRSSLWRSARLSHAQLHVDWPRISGEMYGATTTSFLRNWRERTSPLTGAESIQTKSWNDICDQKIVTSSLSPHDKTRFSAALTHGSALRRYVYAPCADLRLSHGLDVNVEAQALK